MLIVLAVAVRAALMVAGRGAFADPDNYLPLARSLAAGQGLALQGRPTAYRPPLYPLLLAPLVRYLEPGARPGVAALHLGLAGWTVAMTLLAAHRWRLGRLRTLAAGGVAAFDPVLAWQCRFVMTETLTACLLASALATLARGGRRGWVLGGAILGLAALARPSTLPGSVLIVIGAVASGSGSPWERGARGCLFLAALLTVMAPWAVRNTLVFGEPVWTTTHGGYTLALANNRTYYRDVLNGPPGQVWTGEDQWLWWDSVNRETAGMTEPQADRWLREGVIRLALDQPRDFFRASLDRLRRLWSVAPAQAVYSRAIRWVTMIWTVPLWAALGLGLLRRAAWSWPRLAAPLMIAGLSLVHCLYWTDLRMRAPIVPAIALVAAASSRSRLEATTPGLAACPRGSRH